MITGTVVVLAGCGGDDKPKPPSAPQWREHVDTACTRATDAIAKRGWVDDLNDLYRRLPGEVREARAAIHEVRALPLPRGDTDARLFVDELTAFAPMLDELGRAAKATDMHALANAAREVENELRALQPAAERAGLRRCLRREVPWVAIDELRAPVAAEQLARLQLELVDRFRSSPERHRFRAMRRTTAALLAHENALGSIKAPFWAAEAMGRYRSEVRDFRLRLEELLDGVRAGRPPSQARIDAVTRPAVDRVNRRTNELWNRMGADSVTQPPG
jgi:hypothetical protein